MPIGSLTRRPTAVERQKRASRGGVQRRNVLHSRLAPDAASCALIVLCRPAGAARDVESMFVCFLTVLSFDLVAPTMLARRVISLFPALSQTHTRIHRRRRYTNRNNETTKWQPHSADDPPPALMMRRVFAPLSELCDEAGTISQSVIPV